MSENSNDPIDPLKEAAKQYYRDNPGKALEDLGSANLFIGSLIVVSVIIALIFKAIG